ncbi:alpha/beta fold hydrolase [Desulfovibrio sp.]|uniref:alpha/beta hydrolase n=1 Tax=Desulfovibrio sp. TaxID=885 RepID=UPI0023BF81CE|nr:alpha/beta fold hydrolase [Desulfovibrio sp.]MDE7241365.1 alpha/beta fold hydrolase [Desulfovibrio sp.]
MTHSPDGAPGPATALIFHGLAGTPFEVAAVAEALRAEGMAAHTPLLPGHGAGPEAYLASSFAEWRAFARAEYGRLCARGPVLLGGYSLGGILALDIAETAEEDGLPEPAALLLLATPLRFCAWRRDMRLGGPGSWRFRLLPITARLWPVLRVPPRSPEARAAAPWEGHEGLCCLRHFVQMEAALKGIRARLGRVRTSLCVIQHVHDASSPPGQAAWLLARCASREAELHLLRTRSPHGGHLPATHGESRDRVAEIVRAFARRCAPARPHRAAL